MKQIRKKQLLILLSIALGIVAGAAWVFREEFLQHLVRPGLEQIAGSVLDAEVGIERLALADGGLLLLNTSLRRNDGSIFAIFPEIVAGFTLQGLLHRHLETLVLVRPDLVLAPEEERERPSFPNRPPLEAGEMRVRDGGLRIRTPDGPIVLHGIEVRTRGTEPVDFHLAAFAGEGKDSPLLLSGDLLWQDGLSLIFESIAWQEKPLLTAPLTLRFPSDGEESAEGVFRLDRLDSEQLAAVLAALRKEFPLPSDVRFALFSPGVDFGWERGGLRLQGEFERGLFRKGDLSIPLGEGSWRAAKKNGEWEFEGVLSLAGEASGEVRGTFSEGSLKGDLRLRIPDPGEFVFLLTGGSRPPVAGGLIVSGDFSGSGPHFRFEGDFEGMPGEARSEDLLDLSMLSGPLVFERDENAWSGRAALQLGGREIAEAWANGREIALATPPLSGRTLQAVLAPRSRRVIPAGAENARAELRFSPDGGKWSGTADLRAGRIPLPEGTLEQFRLSGRFHPGEESTRFTRLRASSRLAGKGVPNGELSVAGSGAWSRQGWILSIDSLAADGMDYLSPGGDSGFSGGRLQASGSVSGKAGRDAISMDLSGALALKEVLHGTFYAELSDLPGKWSLRGAWVPAAALLQAEELSLIVEQVGSLILEGRIAPGSIESRGRMRLEGLGDAISERFLPALQERFAAARGLGLSGALETEFALETGPDGWYARGTALPAGLNLNGGFFEARNLEGSLPFEIFSGKQPSGAAGQKRRGTLSFSSLSLGPAQLGRDSLEFASSPNRIEIPEPASFGVANGRLEISDFSFARGTNGPEFSAAIDIRGIDLQALTRELGWIEMQGSLDAQLGRIDYAGDSLSSEGNMVIEVFGGTILVSRIRMESPFSAYPLLLASIDFSGIDLYQLTRTFAFGAINGVADGFVHDLRLFGLTPSRFEAVLETRARGTRNISVKALENLTVISQGGLSAALSRGIFRFINFYRYRKLGIWCILHRDVFVLRGTAREDSDRYLVYGGVLPPKIDILAPENPISFREMLNRLRRIERTEGGED